MGELRPLWFFDKLRTIYEGYDITFSLQNGYREVSMPLVISKIPTCQISSKLLYSPQIVLYGTVIPYRLYQICITDVCLLAPLRKA